MLLLGNVQCSQNIDDGPIFFLKVKFNAHFQVSPHFFLRLFYVHHLALKMTVKENML
jgi:hypothetical protein